PRSTREPRRLLDGPHNRHVQPSAEPRHRKTETRIRIQRTIHQASDTDQQTGNNQRDHQSNGRGPRQDPHERSANRTSHDHYLSRRIRKPSYPDPTTIPPTTASTSNSEYWRTNLPKWVQVR